MSGGASLPPGFRFHPTDEELVGYYLKRKVEGLQIELEVIPEVDLYKFDPWELPEKSFLPKRDMEWFFFCPRDRKYLNGSRTNRATKSGYWKATGKDRKVNCQSLVSGYRKTLVFYRGRAPLGDRTDWVMHEYRICDDHSQGSPTFQGAFALCRIIKRNESGQQMADFHQVSLARGSAGCSKKGDLTSSRCLDKSLSASANMSTRATISSPYKAASPAEFETIPVDINPASHWVSPDLILDSSREYSQVQEAVSECIPQYQFPSSSTLCQAYQSETSPSSSHSNFTGEIEYAEDLSRFGCMSPYSGNPYYMGYYGNEYIPFENYYQTSSQHYPEPF